MTIEDLIVRLRIEEDNKAAERRSKGNSTINGAYIIEDDQNNSKKRKKAEQESHQPKKKFKGKRFNCVTIVHNSMDYRASKKVKKKDQANMIESNKECDDLCAMISKCNLVGNPRDYVKTVFLNGELKEKIYMEQPEDFVVPGKENKRHNTIRKFLSSGIITVDYVKSKDNVSDPLTKGLSREGVEKTSKEMGLRPRTSQHGDSETVFRNNTLIHEMMDVSGDGGIDIDEFDSLHQTIMDEHGEEEEDIREVFNMFNQNGYEFLCESCSCFVRTIDQDCKQMIKKNGH
ncbi:putative glucan endo-1,3-beta-glucosidase A-like [Capsicum annuum]|nr:putative glucan endo-1,3-beta-glucosidase A-like [Capsicum annuum]